MKLTHSEQTGQHKLETRRHRAFPYIALGASICFLASVAYLDGEQKGEEEATETRIVGRTVDGYLADNDTFRNRRFLEVFAAQNVFQFMVTTPDLNYKCEGTYKYDEGKVYINEQQISCDPIENLPTIPKPPQKV